MLVQTCKDWNVITKDICNLWNVITFDGVGYFCDHNKGVCRTRSLHLDTNCKIVKLSAQYTRLIDQITLIKTLNNNELAGFYLIILAFWHD